MPTDKQPAVKAEEPEVIEKEVVKVITATTEVKIIKEVPIEIEVIKEVEKIVEVTVTDNELINKIESEKKDLENKIKDLNQKIKLLKNDLKEENKKVEELLDSDAGLMKSLNQKIENLEIELELEKNKNSDGARVFNFANEAYQVLQLEAASKAYSYLIENYPNSRFIPNSKVGFARTLETTLDQEWQKNHNEFC